MENQPMKLDSYKTVTVDVDDTLVMWNISEYPEFPVIELDCYGPVVLAVNQKNVNLVIKLSKLGYKIVIWSQTGYDWAETVSKAVGLHPYASLYMSKPRYYVDDLPSNEWMGTRLWRDPITGKSAEGIRYERLEE